MNLKRKLFIVVLWSTSVITPRHHIVRGEKTFQKLINQYEFAVGCFAESKPEKTEDISRDELRDQREALRDQFRDIDMSLKGASDRYLYEKYLDKEVGFLLIDTASNKAEELDNAYSLKTMPTCILFKRGKPYTTLSQYAQIFAPITQDSVLSLLEKNVQDELEKIIDRKKEQEKLERQERIERYKAYARTPYPYYGGWGYPYYGGWGPGWGVGWYGGYGRYW